MEVLINYLNSGNSFVDLLTAIIVISAVIVSIEKFIKWIYGLLMKFYKQKRGQEEEAVMLDQNINEIKKLSETIENLATLLNSQYRHLDRKIDDQAERITLLDEDGQRRDCAILRDRILGGMRYFGNNKDENGVVCVDITDFENMSHLYAEYFNCHGNGAIKALHDNEFKKWTIKNK